MKTFLLRFFTWWSGTTVGTNLYTSRFGEKVGQDEFGNTYYQTAGGKKDPALGIVRRWVVYAGETEATRVPPGWLGWLRHTRQDSPAEENYRPRSWELPARPNPTGSPAAYRPPGSTLRSGERSSVAEPDYEAWTPR